MAGNLIERIEAFLTGQPAEGEGEKGKKMLSRTRQGAGDGAGPRAAGLCAGPSGAQAGAGAGRCAPGSRGGPAFLFSPPTHPFFIPLLCPCLCHLEPPRSLLMLFLNVPPPRSERSHISPSHTFAFEKRSSCPALGCLPFMSSSYKRGYKTRHGRKEEANESIFQIAKHMVGN